MSSNPFPGLRPFKLEETHLFFGRDGQSEQLLKRLQDSRFLALVGVSGSGKSSLIRAGLLPKLDGGLMAAVDSDWRVAVFRPGNNPIGNMARALVTDAGLGGDSGLDDVEAAIAETTLRRGNLGLLELLREAKKKVREDGQPFLGPNENVLIVVDQFEEIFRIIEQYEDLVRVKQLSAENSKDAATAIADDLKGHPREEASAFVKLLLESTEKNEETYAENVYIIVTMRSDYLGDTAQFLGMPERINEGQYLIPRMDRKERRKAIVGPIAVEKGSITESLLNQLLNDAGEDPGKLPILQHALMRMWDLADAVPQNGGLNLDHYEKIERLEGALSQHADEAFNDLSEKHQKLAPKIFKCLTEKSLANRETRRPMKIAEICEVVGADEDDVKTVVDCFRKNGRWFLMPPVDEKDKLTSDTLVDISHESLISGWNKLRQWVNEEAESARTYKRLADTAILKELGKEDFYRGPALQLALEWRKDNNPNEAWARRYHPEYDKAIAFLNDSLKDTQKKEKAERDRVAKELRRTRTYNIILGLLTIVSAAIGVFAYKTQQSWIEGQNLALLKEQERSVAEKGLKEAALVEQGKAIEASKKAAEESKKARAAEEQAVEAADKLEASLKTEQAALKTAKEAKALAEAQRDTARRLQKENQEQATTYLLFKTAFDHVASREYEEALASLQNAMDFFAEKENKATADPERKESKRNRISTQVNIADVHRSKDQPASDILALQEYDRAIQMIGSSDDDLLAPTLMKAGSVWKDSKQQEQALQAVGYYEQAAPVYDRLGNRIDSSRARVAAGKIHLGFNDPAGFQRAAGHFSGAVLLLQGNNKQIAATSAEIAEAYANVVESEGGANEEDGEGSSPKRDSQKRDARLQERLREDGARYFGGAADAFQLLSDPRSAAEMQAKRGEILSAATSDDNLNASAEAFRSAASLYARAGDVIEQVSVLVQGGESLIQNNSRTAQSWAERLLDQAAEVDQKNAAEQTTTLTRIAAIYADVDQRGWAFQYYHMAIVFARRHNDKDAELTAILANARGIEQLERENGVPELNRLYDDAVRVYDGDPAKQVESVVRFGRAVMGTKRDENARIARAEPFYQKALTLATNQPDKKLVASTHLSIGVAYWQIRPDKAREHYNSALAIYEAERDLYGQAMALYRLGTLTGKDASEFRDRSLGIFEKLLPLLATSRTRIEQAETYYAMGSLYRRKQNFEASLKSYNRSLDIYQTLPDQSSRVNNIKSLIRTIQRQSGITQL